MMAKLPTILASGLIGWRHDCASTRPANDSFMKRWPLQFIHRHGVEPQGPNEMEGASPATGRGWLSMAPPAQHPILWPDPSQSVMPMSSARSTPWRSAFSAHSEHSSHTMSVLPPKSPVARMTPLAASNFT